MGQSDSCSNNPYSENVKSFRRNKYPVCVSTPPVIVVRHPFQQCVSYARMVNLARDDVWRLLKTPPLVSICLVGWWFLVKGHENYQTNNPEKGT
jgi:hypothetical protein